MNLISTLLVLGWGTLAIMPSSCNKKEPSNPDTAITGLTLDEANQEIAKIDAEEKAKSVILLQDGWQNKQFSYNSKVLKFKTATYGDKPADGRSLYISMHGGGNATPAINDGQWNNQVAMTSNNPTAYNIKEGVVVVPRAPVNEWNMWFIYEIDNLFEDVIRAATLFADVNPNKVYIMGYSAGGDGTFRLATRMADHWAAASMSAGHPGECTPANLRNIGFALNMGGLDAAFNRNGLAKTWQTNLQKLQTEDPQGYKHMVNIFANKPHWMNMEDRVAIPFMAGFARNPYPNKVVWGQNIGHIRNYFYWLGISNEDTKAKDIADNPQKIITASYINNTINIENNYADTLYIYLNDKMMDLDKEVILTFKGQQLFKGKVQRNKKVIEETASQRKDSDYIFSAMLTVTNNATVKVNN